MHLIRQERWCETEEVIQCLQTSDAHVSNLFWRGGDNITKSTMVYNDNNFKPCVSKIRLEARYGVNDVRVCITIYKKWVLTTGPTSTLNFMKDWQDTNRRIWVKRDRSSNLTDYVCNFKTVNIADNNILWLSNTIN